MSDLATTVTVIDACGMAGVTPLLVSEPGTGKSSLVRGLARSQGVAFEQVLGSLSEPADFSGLPVVTDEGVRLEAPAWAKRIAAAGCGYVLLDELTTVPETTQAAMLGTALDKMVGDLQLPPEVRVVAACNPPHISAGGAELTAPMANRLCHIDYTPTVADWLEGVTNGWSTPPASRAISGDATHKTVILAQVTGFINANPTLLQRCPRTTAETSGAWPSKRVWTQLIGVLEHLRTDDAAARQVAACGMVGEGPGIEFLEWAATMDLPNPADVIADPSIVDWSARPDQVWSVLNSVAGWAADRGTVDDWRKAWGPLLAAVEAGAPDVAAAVARTLGKSRPASAKVPASVRTAFGPVLTGAGITL